MIIGAGATCETCIYVFAKLNISPIIYNRSAERLGNFPNTPGFTNFEELLKFVGKNNAEIDVIYSAVPPNSDFNYPDELFRNKPIIFESSYIPRVTNII